MSASVFQEFDPSASRHHVAPLVVLYENDAWMDALLNTLDTRGVAYEAIDLTRDAWSPNDLAPGQVVFNRVSPSAESRGHGAAIDRVRSSLDALERRGVRVINGASSFALETSKLAQHELIRSLGLTVPRTVVLSDTAGFHGVPADFPFPAILKPDTGGSGIGVRFVGSRRALGHLRQNEPLLFADGSTLLLQAFVSAPDGSIMRTEFVDGDLLYAMRVRPDNTFNLCPAEGCEREAIDGDHAAHVDFAHAPDASGADLDAARAIVRAAGLEVGGVEYIEAHDGTSYFYDINATSSYRGDVAAEAGIDAMNDLVSFLEREVTTNHLCLQRCAA